MLKRFFTLALLVIPLFGAGSVVQVGPTRLSTGSGNLVGNTWTLTLTVTGDASTGSVPGTVLNSAGIDIPSSDGMTIVSMVTDPGSPAPTTLYDIVITDARGYDLLGGTGANRSATVTENAAPTAPVPINGAITFSLSNNSVASATITVVITMTNSTVAKNGGSSSGSYAPNDATYLLQTANASLANAQAMGALATGLVKNTTTTGVQSIVVPGTGVETWIATPTPANLATALGVTPVYGGGSLTGSTSFLYDSATGVAALGNLFREDANTVAQRNGTTGQNFYSYNTYSSAGANYERFQFGWTANAATIFVDKLGTGATRNLNIQTYGTVTLLPGNNTVATFFGNGNVAFAGSISNSQGTLSGSSTPAYTHVVTWSNAATTFVDDFRNITDTNSAAGSLLVQWQVGGVNQFRVGKDGSIISAATTPLDTGNLKLIGSSSVAYLQGNTVAFRDYAGTGSPTLVAWGPLTSSFPALKRSTTDLQARLADDSGFTSFQGQYKSTDGTAGATTTCTIAGLISITIKNGLVTACS